MEQTQFTSYMQSVMDGIMDRVKSFYCREDIERKLQEVMSQHRKKQSGYHFRLRELNEMCEGCGIDPVELCDPDTMEAELDKLPRRHELRRELITELHNIYREFPTSGQYMERLVRRLLNGEFAEDSLRMAILKKILRDTGYESRSILSLAENRMSDAQRKEYASLSASDKKCWVIDHLDEGIFDALESELDPRSHLRFLKKQVLADEAGEFCLSPDLMAECGCGGSAAECLDSLEKLMEEGGAKACRETLERAEKEFCLYLKKFSYTKKKAKDPKRATGTKDEVYRQAKKDFVKPMKKSLSLLKLADDLACGKFRVNGTTREQLYIFAIAFGMSAGGDSQRDVEKNLFHDYYNDNLLRYVLDEEYIRSNTSYETEPGGEGINYKNYVEVIYLYYLSRFPELSPGDKLERIQKLIDRCAKQARDSADRVKAPPTEHTAFFRDNYMPRILGFDDEDDLADFICSHFYIHNPEYSSARISYAARRNTAAAFYREIAGRMLREYPESFGSKYDNIELTGGINLPELLEKLRSENPEDSYFVCSVLEDRAFIGLLEKLDSKLQMKKRRIMSLCERGDEAGADCTRTELISLYSCYFRLVLEELTEDFGVMDFPSLFQEFCEGDGLRPGINHYLRESRYQTISPKNAYDMFVIFSLFLELLNWGE